mmetsp:Transcript_3242/g.6116  ORF Transcript_3242/g.6116 Transcript_3242/m.6116 type:complete len:510 (-) Transcript_3242:35-1564(-)
MPQDYSDLLEEEQEAFDSLHAARKERADEEECPVYHIAQNRALCEVCRQLPQSLDELEDCWGFGPAKAAKYGRFFLDLLKPFEPAIRKAQEKKKAEFEDAKTEPSNADNADGVEDEKLPVPPVKPSPHVSSCPAATILEPAKLLFSDSRWRRYHRAPTSQGKCFHCQLPIAKNSLRLWLPLYVHQTPPAAHASCELRFDLWNQLYTPKEWNQWQKDKFALVPVLDLTQEEQRDLVAWIAGGLKAKDTPSIVGPAVSEENLAKQVKAAEKWAAPKFKARGMKQVIPPTDLVDATLTLVAEAEKVAKALESFVPPLKEEAETSSTVASSSSDSSVAASSSNPGPSPSRNNADTEKGPPQPQVKVVTGHSSAPADQPIVKDSNTKTSPGVLRRRSSRNRGQGSATEAETGSGGPDRMGECTHEQKKRNPKNTAPLESANTSIESTGKSTQTLYDALVVNAQKQHGKKVNHSKLWEDARATMMQALPKKRQRKQEETLTKPKPVQTLFSFFKR